MGSTLAKRNGVSEWFWDFMKQARLENMPEQLKVAYKQVAPSTNGLQVMHDRDAKRMVNFKDITDEQINFKEDDLAIPIIEKFLNKK